MSDEQHTMKSAREASLENSAPAQARLTFLGHVSRCEDCVKSLWGAVQLCGHGKRLEKNWLRREPANIQEAYRRRRHDNDIQLPGRVMTTKQTQADTKQQEKEAKEQARLAAEAAEQAERLRQATIFDAAETRKLQMLTCKEVASLLKVSPRTVYNLPVRVYKVRGAARWSEEEIRQYLQRSATRPAFKADPPSQAPSTPYRLPHRRGL